MRKSGPITANTKASAIVQPNPARLCRASSGMLTSASGTQPSASTSALMRKGEYRCISGAIATE